MSAVGEEVWVLVTDAGDLLGVFNDQSDPLTRYQDCDWQRVDSLRWYRTYQRGGMRIVLETVQP